MHFFAGSIIPSLNFGIAAAALRPLWRYITACQVCSMRKPSFIFKIPLIELAMRKRNLRQIPMQMLAAVNAFHHFTIQFEDHQVWDVYLITLPICGIINPWVSASTDVDVLSTRGVHMASIRHQHKKILCSILTPQSSYGPYVSDMDISWEYASYAPLDFVYYLPLPVMNMF